MKLENALKNFHPKSPTFGNVAGCTFPDRITGTDIMAAMGMTESQAKFGMTAFLAKNDISEEDKFSTVEALTQYALKVAPKLVRKAAGKELGCCLIILAKMAFEDYARSAGSVCQCSACSGKGMIDKKVITTKYSTREAIFPSFSKSQPKRYTNTERDVVETEKVICESCNGKGQLTHRCRCKGRGKVLDEEQTKLQGAPVFKDCPRCEGRGFSRVPSSVAFNAIKHLVPDLNERTWRRNWKPFYEKLTNKCFIEESAAEQAFSKVIK
ncbi:TPA: antitermination protein [Providencia stuartii]|uniref:antitermination protein n=1 Tax=Providencia stuartii TaxID=588 RepID=UPI000536D8A3|nr:antitermination protein [Providencia stuartii]AXO20674.1 antitermination protein [Providencia stuartii]MBN5590017.1 antitermination protein [Providencia stuartii]HEM6907354.1 antitermination protein [Providencia stuartii]HEM7154472.1 antitermination protein [Providencia stuartii]HEM7522842.1 antitermination protein [Providencia stuartii]